MFNLSHGYRFCFAGQLLVWFILCKLSFNVDFSFSFVVGLCLCRTNDGLFQLWGRYASIRAIETKSPVDDQQWLTYWVLHSLITLFELTFYKALEW